MSKETLVELLNSAGDDAFFVGPADEVRIQNIERSLGVVLPDSYKWFLREYGHGGVFGLEIIGSGLANVPSCVPATLNWRPWGLPESFVVIEEEGTDWIYCLDTSQMKNGECPVVDWVQNEGVGKEHYDNFYDFLEAKVRESLDFEEDEG